MSIEQTITQISQLPIEDQLKIINSVWDRMGENAATEPNNSQRKELDERMERYRQNPESAMTEAELRAKLEKRREGI